MGYKDMKQLESKEMVLSYWEKQALNCFRFTCTPEVFYERDDHDMILLHSWYAGHCDTLLSTSKISDIPNFRLSQKEMDSFSANMSEDGVKEYYNSLIEVIQIFEKYKSSLEGE